MSTDVDIERALATVTATLNDQRLEHFEADRVREMITASLGGESSLGVDDGGGVHDEHGVRVAAIRRTPSGEWIAERQNETAARSDAAIPAKPPQTKLRGMLARLMELGRSS